MYQYLDQLTTESAGYWTCILKLGSRSMQVLAPLPFFQTASIRTISTMFLRDHHGCHSVTLKKTNHKIICNRRLNLQCSMFFLTPQPRFYRSRWCVGGCASSSKPLLKGSDKPYPMQPGLAERSRNAQRNMLTGSDRKPNIE